MKTVFITTSEDAEEVCNGEGECWYEMEAEVSDDGRDWELVRLIWDSNKNL